MVPAIIDFAIWMTFATVLAMAFSQGRHRALNRSFVVLAGCCAIFGFFEFARELPVCAPYRDQLTALAGMFELITGVLFAHFVYRLIGRPSDGYLWFAYGWTALTICVFVIDSDASSSLVHVYQDLAADSERVYFAGLFLTPVLTSSLGVWMLLGYRHRRRLAGGSTTSPPFLVVYSIVAVVVTAGAELVWPLSTGKHFPYELGLLATAGLVVVGFIELRRHSLFEVDSERVLAHLLRDVEEGVALVDSRGRIYQMNPWMKEMLGIAPVDDQPKDMAGLLPVEWDADDGRDVEFQLVRAGVEHTYRLSRTAFSRGGRKVGAVCFVRDVSEARLTEELTRMSREELEQEVARRSEEFFQTQKMAAVGALAPGIVHDFNNMLATIIGLVSAAQSDLTANHPITEDIDEILRAAYRARDLVSQIPTERSEQTVERTVVKLGRIVDDVVGQVAVSLGSNIEMKHTASEGPSFVLGNPTQLHQLVLNLTNNAIQEMKHTGGELFVQLDTIELEGAAVVAQTNLEPGSYVRLSVRDTGRGMDADTLSQVFEPFFTTKDTGEGTGLGLALSRKVALEHEGAIVAESRLGEGSSFSVFLPSIVRDTWQSISPEYVAEGGDEHLLIVDDDESVGHAMQRLLGTLGYRVTVVHDAFEAVLLFKNSPDSFDMVLTDYSMPGMNGLNLAAAIFAERPDIPVVLITGVSDNEDLKREADEAGVREVIFKPATREGLAEMVRRAVDQ